MITDDVRARIRRLFHAEHWKINTIAAELGLHHNTVELALCTHRFSNPRFQSGPSKLDPYRELIGGTLEQYPRLRASRLFEMLRDRGYDGSIGTLRRYVRRVRPRPQHEAFFRLTTLPGEQAQVDWGSFGMITVGNCQRRLSCFVMVLAWSRATFARFTLDQTLESFIRCHVEALQTFGGAPREALYDNLKSVVLERQGDLIRFHPQILELAGHYHFAPKPVGVRRGNEKGRVERRIRDLRESFFAARPFSSLSDLNGQVDRWVEQIAHARNVPDDPSLTVREALEQERERLLPLPEHPFVCDRMLTIRSGKTPYVRFDCNDYSIPHTLTRKPLTLLASDTTVRVLDSNVEVARHARCWEKGHQIEDDAHLEGLAEVKRKARAHRGQNRLAASCPSATEFLQQLALHGGHLGGTTARLLRLLDQYGAAELEQGIAEAHKRNAFAAQSVAHVLDQRRRARGAPTPIEPVLPDNPRLRNIVLVPHALDSYDRLAAASATETPEGDHD
ncbi:MAG TPA: IS21 family transposase [Chloroflexi bacterium]|jgi:transposase|nr:IS21 family transposase [Chloroflexota bacterium]